ncbi:glycosyltransferase family A protein [Methanosphaera sp. BMS]|uniref:glycosyltransferase family A protein n=1 Tax=Methanosphaera sp. BMS TaxID=1789762 RepID=UPI000DC1DF7E|nr:glycosyltransferase family A protein [Methanosphaera sp. BMS]AWX32303.1 hypothetical protein AW729_03915 [Methanosphaera sp. BMS]
MDNDNYNVMNDFKFTVFLQIKTNANLKYSLESILNQTLPFEKNIQIIILNQSNDKNTDKTILEYYNRYPSNILLYSDTTSPIYDLYKKTSNLSKENIVFLLIQTIT